MAYENESDDHGSEERITMAASAPEESFGCEIAQLGSSTFEWDEEKAACQSRSWQG